MEAILSPLIFNPLRFFAGFVVVFSIGFSAGWATNGWRLKSKIAEVKVDAAESRAKSADAALSQLESRVQKMNSAAALSQTDITTLGRKLDNIGKDLKNVQAQKQLPRDCAPDSARLHSLREAVNATNAAIEGSATR